MMIFDTRTRDTFERRRREISCPEKKIFKIIAGIQNALWKSGERANIADLSCRLKEAKRIARESNLVFEEIDATERELDSIRQNKRQEKAEKEIRRLLGLLWDNVRHKNLTLAFELLQEIKTQATRMQVLQARVFIVEMKMNWLIGNHEHAVIVALELVRFQKTDISLGYLGDAYRKNQDYIAALEILSQMSEDNYHRWVRSAYCQMHLRQYDKCFYDFNLAKKLYEDQNIACFFGLRLFCGIIFFYDLALNDCFVFKLEHKQLIDYAVVQLRGLFAPARTSWQYCDYIKALNIIEVRHL